MSKGRDALFKHIDLKKPARKWYELGIPVVPCRIYRDENGKWEKEPLVKWGKWENNPQSEEEFENLPWDEANGYAIICGTRTRSGLYVFVIDLDLDAGEAVKKLQTIKQSKPEIFKETRIEKTVSNRLHLIYLSKSPVRCLSRRNKDDDIPIELLGAYKLCVMAPSYGYAVIEDVLPAIVEDGTTYFLDLIEALGYNVEKLFSLEAEEKGREKLEKMLEKIKTSGKLKIENETRKWLYCHCPFHPPDSNPSFAINLEKYYAVDFHDNTAYSLKRLIEKLGIGLGVGDKSSNSREEKEGKSRERERHRKILSLLLPGSNIVFEAIGIPNGLGEYDPKLLVYGSAGFQICDEYTFDNTVLEPKHPRSYPYTPYVVNNFQAVKNRIELIELVYREVDKFIDAEPVEKVLFTAFGILSYVQELFETIPYLYLIGDNDSGKTHLLILMSHLCYRPMFGVSIPPADIYSYLEDDIPLTIIEDELQGSEKDDEKIKIYKTGYKRGAKVPRVITFEGGRRIDYYPCYGVKIVASEKLIENKGFLERCIVVEMVKGYPEKDHYDKQDYERFSQLRGELLKWRMRVLAGGEPLPALDLEWLRGRDRELYLPLLTVLHGSKFYGILEDFLKQKVEERMLERSSSLEAFIVKICMELVKEKNEIVFNDLWRKLLEEVDGEEVKAPHSLTVMSMHSEAYGNISKKDIANILKTKLGMQKRKTTKDGKLTVIYIPNMNKLYRAYGKYLGNFNIRISDISDHSKAPISENRLESAQKPDFPRLPEGGSLQQSDRSDIRILTGTFDHQPFKGGFINDYLASEKLNDKYSSADMEQTLLEEYIASASRVCYICREETSDLYRIKLYGLGFKMLCRKCAGEAIA
jgi:hypothetical protein